MRGTGSTSLQYIVRCRNRRDLAVLALSIQLEDPDTRASGSDCILEDPLLDLKVALQVHDGAFVDVRGDEGDSSRLNEFASANRLV